MRTVPADPGARRPETPLKRRTLQEPAPARPADGQEGSAPNPGDRLGEAPSQPKSLARSGPFPAPSEGEEGGQSCSRDRLLVPSWAVHAKARVRKGAGARWGEERKNSRSSWPRPCRRSAPPAPPAGLSAPVAHDPPSSRAESGRTRRPGRPKELGGRLRCGWSPCAGRTAPRSKQLRRRQRGDCSSSTHRGTWFEAAAAAVRAAGGQPPEAPPTPRDATCPAYPPAHPAPALPLFGLPLPSSSGRRLLSVPSFLAGPQHSVFHFPRGPALQLLQTPPKRFPFRPPPRLGSGAWIPESCSSSIREVVSWGGRGQRGCQDYIFHWS